MTTAAPPRNPAFDKFTLLCVRCDRPMLVNGQWAQREVSCPHCESVNRVPTPPETDEPVRGKPPLMGGSYQFNFPCGRCDVLLEAHTGMSGNPARCPACGSRMIVPYIKRTNRLPEKAELLEEDNEPLNPVHAYAADGVAAPEFVSGEDGTTLIKCPRCSFLSDVDADACEQCETPFTLVAAQTRGEIDRDRRAMVSSVFGVIGFVAFPIFVPALIAVYLGAQSLLYVGYAERSHLGWIGLTLGVFGLVGGISFWYVALQP